MHGHAAQPGAPPGRTSFELADVVRLCGTAVAAALPLGREERRLLRDVEACRTAALGGHLDVCRVCGHERPSYNSCRNRHCPKCQALRQARWVAERQRRVLPTHHFHVVFTLPAPLRSVCRRHRRTVFDLLLSCAAETLLDLGRDPKRLGAQLGATAVLHTWRRDLGWHPHVHCIVSGGGLDACRDRWVASKPRFLFPVRVMGDLFRGKMLAALRRAVAAGKIDLGAAEPEAEAFFAKLYATNWVVYAKRPFGGAEQVIRYLGRYTHRVAISNARIEHVSSDTVRFRTKAGTRVTLPPEVFLRRFLLHVLPSGFTKIRHYGLYAAGNVHGRLARARAELSAASDAPPPASEPAPRSTAELVAALLGIDPTVCSRCGARALVARALPRSAANPPAYRDTS